MKSNIYLQLFSSFLKIGAFTFGGGWAMIPLIEREVVDKKQWIKREDFIDALAIAQSLPGVLAVNISILVGNKLRGLKGSLAATLGTILPSFLIILAIAIWFVQVYDNPVIERIFKGIRPAVVALIVSPVLTTAKTARINLKTVIIPIVVALAIWLGGISPIWFVLLGGIGGIVYYNHIITRIKKRYREKKK
ncbi:chromate transporter [Barnesiella viscericola]|uniref:Chromate transporter n=1 Tax=Barnesiella viscericola TaxID=397865 RepID=A0A921SV19_9BACT|nr:chromate transporter [Barnesiella viscericola]HJG89256.1 chromate transporter [Barnesiella viscericola]